MEMQGERRIPAPRQLVWEKLNDPEALKQAIPGCETIEKVSDTEFTAKVRAKVGPVSASFSGKVMLTDLDPPNGYTISGEGQGGIAGQGREPQISPSRPRQSARRSHRPSSWPRR